jgi:phosphatidylserine/phosphatidylglycerophosphate/cardiolipin synthase-like enzyme
MASPVPGSIGQHTIQIARTYGNGRSHSGVSGGYRFAPNGEQTARRMILHAIDQARRFIYLEDQYLVSMDVRRLVALPRINTTIVILHTNLLSSTECPQILTAPRGFRARWLRAAAVSSICIAGRAQHLVHSKMWVIDDEFAIIGSANCNRRSYTHDSEVTAGIYDPERSFAKQLRIALWAKHLNMAPSALADGVTSARFWLSPPPGAHVAPFNHLAPVSTGNAPRCRLASWDTHIDPDGS